MTDLSRVVLVISLTVNVFLFASLAMYGTWLLASSLDVAWRGVTSLLVWVLCFGAGTIAFWKIVEKISISKS